MTQPDKPRTICTDDYKPGFYGILNAQGDFWTPLIFDSQAKAQKHLDDFARSFRPYDPSAIARHRVVRVRATIETIDTPKETPDAR